MVLGYGFGRVDDFAQLDPLWCLLSGEGERLLAVGKVSGLALIDQLYVPSLAVDYSHEHCDSVR
jgi:hypothetical protein